MSLGTEIALIKALGGNGGGSGGGVLVVTDTDGTLDKTWQEIHDAPVAVVHRGAGDQYTFYKMHDYMGNKGGNVDFIGVDANMGRSSRTYIADSASDYPVMES